MSNGDKKLRGKGNKFSMNKPVGVGVIGVGSLGGYHAYNLAWNTPGANLVAIADPRLDVASEVASKTGVRKVYSDYRKLLEDKEVDAVVVAVPNNAKLDIVRSAAQASKHVFVEKPISLSLEDADLLVRIKKESGLKFQVGYQRRFDPSHMKIKEIIDSGELGRIALIRSNTRDKAVDPSTFGDPKVTGGILVDLSSHDFDVVRWLSGSEVSTVAAAGTVIAHPEIKQKGDLETLMVILSLRDGALAHVDACRSSTYGYDLRVEVVGTEGAVFMPRARKTDITLVKSNGEKNQYFDWFKDRFSDAFRDELSHFVECVARDQNPKVTIEDGRAALEISLAVDRSIAEGKSIVLPSMN